MASRSRNRFKAGERTAIIRVHVTQAEKELAERAALADDRSLSSYVRHVVLQSLRSGPKEAEGGERSTGDA